MNVSQYKKIPSSPGRKYLALTHPFQERIIPPPPKDWKLWGGKYLEIFGVELEDNKVWEEEGSQQGIMPSSKAAILSRDTVLGCLEIHCNSRRSPGALNREEHFFKNASRYLQSEIV